MVSIKIICLLKVSAFSWTFSSEEKDEIEYYIQFLKSNDSKIGNGKGVFAHYDSLVSPIIDSTILNYENLNFEIMNENGKISLPVLFITKIELFKLHWFSIIPKYIIEFVNMLQTQINSQPLNFKPPEWFKNYAKKIIEVRNKKTENPMLK